MSVEDSATGLVLRQTRRPDWRFNLLGDRAALLLTLCPGMNLLSSVRYQGIDIEGKWRGGGENPKLSTEIFELVPETSMDGTYIVHSMKQADIYDYGDGSFVCRSDCSLLDKSKGTLVEGTILYSFRRD